jgi:hypothetical protein
MPLRRPAAPAGFRKIFRRRRIPRRPPRIPVNEMATEWKDDDMRYFLLVVVMLLFLALGALEVVASRVTLPLP